jgi:hypothetical protein
MKWNHPLLTSISPMIDHCAPWVTAPLLASLLCYLETVMPYVSAYASPLSPEVSWDLLNSWKKLEKFPPLSSHYHKTHSFTTVCLGTLKNNLIMPFISIHASHQPISPSSSHFQGPNQMSLHVHFVLTVSYILPDSKILLQLLKFCQSSQNDCIF